MRFSRQLPLPSILKKTWVRLAVLATMGGIAATQTYLHWGDSAAIGHYFVIMLSVTTVGAVVFGTLYHQRVWCSVCPVGSLSSWIGKTEKPLTLDSSKCIQCKVCESVCPMQLKPHASRGNGKVAICDGDCLLCGTCVKNCPVGALAFEPRAKPSCATKSCDSRCTTRCKPH
jgi:ferredoxin